ncbi:MAG TPA: hypothetical protein VHD63_15860 [Ktedonobacteraceae bacterium]|nr:hypothetical protein [Ktedonobacteraceae bacterium]
MRPIEPVLAKSILFLILGGFDFGFLVISYGVLRVLRISVNWITWIIGSAIMLVGLAFCLSMFQPALFPEQIRRLGNPMGAIAFLVAVYTASQWITRQWYLRIKKDAGRWLKNASKNVLIFLRKHHVFFGWIVATGSLVHLVFFLPDLRRISLYEEITGFIAIGILALMVLLGLWLWIEATLRRRRMPRPVHTIHAVLTIAFFVVLFLHI